MSAISNSSRTRDSGFTLIEAIVALVCFAGVFVAVQLSLNRGMRGLRIGDREAAALEIARSVLQTAGATNALKDALHETGESGGMFWEKSVSKYIPEASSDEPTKIDGYWVSVDVDWRESAGLHSRRLSLKTLKIVPAP
ncbi:type II secretion system protein [Hyphomicrobium sp. 99]|uniref:type II secretion system protein n=1 Tax=Hyphomicrobium sp. 99 TaxID=1163419 RepID=UPI0005F878F4|nr:type II secretion system protein [Hyphomicrobium sp. 99]